MVQFCYEKCHQWRQLQYLKTVCDRSRQVLFCEHILYFVKTDCILWKQILFIEDKLYSNKTDCIKWKQITVFSENTKVPLFLVVNEESLYLVKTSDELSWVHFRRCSTLCSWLYGYSGQYRSYSLLFKKETSHFLQVSQ